MNPASAQLAARAAAFLAPFLPYLLKVGEKAVEEVGKKFGGAAWEKAQALWGKLKGQPQVAAAACDVAALPDDEDALAAFRLQLKKALAADEALATALQTLLAGLPPGAPKFQVQNLGPVTGQQIGDGNVMDLTIGAGAQERDSLCKDEDATAD